MKNQYLISVQLTLTGPLLTCGSEMSEPGIDAPMARDRFGRYMLPFSLVKGKVLDAMVDRGVDPRLRNAWLGASSVVGGYDPERGRLRFSDFHTEAPGAQGKLIERIQIDGSSGTTARHMLMMIEAPFGYGEQVIFKGEVEFIGTESECQAIVAELEQALRWVPSFGAYRTVGYGRTKALSVSKSFSPNRMKGTTPVSEILPIRLTLDRPLCIVGRKHSRNHFESLEVISGAVLKGTVAHMIQELTGSGGRALQLKTDGEFAALRRHFEKIRFTEARPTPSGSNRRPVEPPLSIVTSPASNSKGKFFDVALSDGPHLIHGAAPTFVPDWKFADFRLVRTAFGWHQLPVERRSRTAIDSETYRAADQQLFSYGLVLPDQEVDGKIESWVWEGSIGLEQIPSNEHAIVRQELEVLLKHGIVGIGKTRAVAAVEWLRVPTPPNVGSTPQATPQAIVTLQTEFLMNDPALLQSDSSKLRATYEQYWRDASDGTIELVRFFARQSLFGGFLSQRSNSHRYEPFLVTDRGSTFVLKLVDPEAARKLLAKWEIQGLPEPNWVAPRYTNGNAPLWQCCPFLTHAGYGEIAVDLECHQSRFPHSNILSGELE